LPLCLDRSTPLDRPRAAEARSGDPRTCAPHTPRGGQARGQHLGETVTRGGCRKVQADRHVGRADSHVTGTGLERGLRPLPAGPEHRGPRRGRIGPRDPMRPRRNRDLRAPLLAVSPGRSYS
jgi:hypothetical protein